MNGMSKFILETVIIFIYSTLPFVFSTFYCFYGWATVYLTSVAYFLFSSMGPKLFLPDSSSDCREGVGGR